MRNCIKTSGKARRLLHIFRKMTNIANGMGLLAPQRDIMQGEQSILPPEVHLPKTRRRSANQNECRSMNDTKTIHLERLSIGYAGKKGKKTVASNIHADICSGELTCLLGSNGIGKSTLLRTLSAFQPPLEGHISILGRPVETYTPKQLARTICIVLTERPEVRNLSVDELVGLGRTPYTGFWGMLSKTDRASVEHAIDMVGIRPLAARMVDTLSDGEQQKVWIAKALAQDTPIILLDEPTAFLDYPGKVEIMQLLHRLSRETHKTIFLSTHDVELAMQIADKFWLLTGHGGVKTGTPEDLVLDGSLSHFFARREGIVFDSEAGEFRIAHACTAQIRLTGCGTRYTMARKALLRNGILAGQEFASPGSIAATGNAFVLHRPHQSPKTLHSIEELLYVLRQPADDTTAPHAPVAT